MVNKCQRYFSLTFYPYICNQQIDYVEAFQLKSIYPLWNHYPKTLHRVFKRQMEWPKWASIFEFHTPSLGRLSYCLLWGCTDLDRNSIFWAGAAYMIWFQSVCITYLYSLLETFRVQLISILHSYMVLICRILPAGRDLEQIRRHSSIS